LLAATEYIVDNAARKDIVDSTCGIVFLGTPHNGSPLSMPAAALAFVSGILGSDTTLLYALRDNSAQLFDLENNFRNLVNNQEGRREKLKIVSFYEKLPTRAFGLFSIGKVSVSALYLNLAGCLTLPKTVEDFSAIGFASKWIPVYVNHVDLNKSPKIYGDLTDTLHSLKSYAVLMAKPPYYLQLTVQV
jgi:hypothetical protein